MNEPQGSDAARTPYERFLAGLGREATAAECEQWAERHAGDPEQPRALVDAGWSTARGGDSASALVMFRRAAEFGGECGRDAQVGIVEQLYSLRRWDEADAAQRALRAELDDLPVDQGVLRVLNDMAELLSDIHRDALALEWCQAGLDRAALAGDDAEVAAVRRSLLVTRSCLREELGIELDEEDRAEFEAADRSLAEVSALIDARLDALAQAQKLAPPDAGTPFDSVVLRWVRADFAEVRSRWPESTSHYGGDYDTYAERIQREAYACDQAGATRVHLVDGVLADYEAFAERERCDPADQSTRQAYGRWCITERPDRVRLWPPARNGACWCDSGRKYKKCCGTPAAKRP